MTETNPKRHWFQFSLRMLLLVTAIIAVWVDAQVHHAKRIKRAVAELQSVKAEIIYDYEFGDDPLYPPLWAHLANENPTAPKWIRSIFGDEYFVEISDVTITDATDDLRFLDDLPNLQALSLERSAITDAALPHLKSLSKLRWLWLDKTAVTDQGLHELESLKNLRYLYMPDTRVTQQGAKALKRALPNVTILYGANGNQVEGEFPPSPYTPPQPK
jgi:hypothetical protein